MNEVAVATSAPAVRAFATHRAGGALERYDFHAGPLGAQEIEIAVSHCGLCHSDLSLIDDDWHSSVFPLVPGHEIVGKVIAIGSAVRHLPLGVRVGVGWQRTACLACPLCAEGQEQLCAAQAATCIGHHGGLANRVRVDARFAFSIPEELPSALAAPLLCGGVTVLAPLFRHHIGASSSVGVIGVGGLGHLALLFLRAIGCQVIAFSSSPDKRAEAIALGAHEFVSSTSPREIRRHRGRFHLLLSTVNARLDWITFLDTVRPNGTLCLVGVPPGLLTLPPALLFTGQRSITASEIGGREDVARTLRFAARHRIEPRIETLPVHRVNDAIERLRENRARYRLVLEH